MNKASNKTVKLTLIFGFIFVLYYLLVLFVVPYFLAQQLPIKWRDMTGTSVKVSSIHVNPLSFEIKLQELNIKDTNNKTSLIAQSLTANFNPTYLLWGQYHLTDIQLNQATLFAHLNKDWQIEAPQIKLADNSSGEPINLKIENISIEQSSIQLITPSIKQTINIQGQLKNVNLSNDPIETLLTLATEQQETIQLKANIKPANGMLNAQFEFKQWHNIGQWLPAELAIDLNAGELSGSGQIKGSLNTLPNIEMDWIEWCDVSGRWTDTLHFKDVFIRAEQLKANLNARQLTLKSIATELGHWNVHLPQNFDELGTKETIISDQIAKTNTSNEWQFQIDHATVYESWLTLTAPYTDKNSISFTVDHALLHHIKNFSLPEQFSMVMFMNAESDTQGQISVKGETNKETVAVVNIEDMPLSPFNPWINKLAGIGFSTGQVNTTQQLTFKPPLWQTEGRLSLLDVQIENESGQNMANLNELDIGHLLANSEKQILYLDQITADQAFGQLFSPEKNQQVNVKSASQPSSWQVILGTPNNDDHSPNALTTIKQ